MTHVIDKQGRWRANFHGLKFEPANLVVFDPDATWQVQPARLASKSRNTPFVGVELRGKVRHTLLRGEPVVRDGKATK